MRQRDLSRIHFGSLRTYDTWPHTRTWLAWMRDSAITQAELDRVAEIADKFDAEDDAEIEAAEIVRHVQDAGDAHAG